MTKTRTQIEQEYQAAKKRRWFESEIKWSQRQWDALQEYKRATAELEGKGVPSKAEVEDFDKGWERTVSRLGKEDQDKQAQVARKLVQSPIAPAVPPTPKPVTSFEIDEHGNLAGSAPPPPVQPSRQTPQHSDVGDAGLGELKNALKGLKELSGGAAGGLKNIGSGLLQGMGNLGRKVHAHVLSGINDIRLDLGLGGDQQLADVNARRAARGLTPYASLGIPGAQPPVRHNAPYSQTAPGAPGVPTTPILPPPPAPTPDGTTTPKITAQVALTPPAPTPTPTPTPPAPTPTPTPTPTPPAPTPTPTPTRPPPPGKTLLPYGGTVVTTPTGAAVVPPAVAARGMGAGTPTPPVPPGAPPPPTPASPPPAPAGLGDILRQVYHLASGTQQKGVASLTGSALGNIGHLEAGGLGAMAGPIGLVVARVQQMASDLKASARHVGAAMSSQRVEHIGGNMAGAYTKLMSAADPTGMSPFTKMGEFAEGLFNAVGALRDWTEGLHSANMQFAQFSPKMAQVWAEQLGRDIELSQRRGEWRAPSAGRLAEQKHLFNEQLAPWEDAWGILMNQLGTGVLGALNGILGGVNNLVAKEDKKGQEEGSDEQTMNEFFGEVFERWQANTLNRPVRFPRPGGNGRPNP